MEENANEVFPKRNKTRQTSAKHQGRLGLPSRSIQGCSPRIPQFKHTKTNSYQYYLATLQSCVLVFHILLNVGQFPPLLLRDTVRAFELALKVNYAPRRAQSPKVWSKRIRMAGVPAYHESLCHFVIKIVTLRVRENSKGGLIETHLYPSTRGLHGLHRAARVFQAPSASSAAQAGLGPRECRLKSSDHKGLGSKRI